MKQRIELTIATLLMIMSGYSYQVAANTFQLFGRVTDQSANPIPGTVIDVIDPASEIIVNSTSTDGNGNYGLFIADGTYNIRATPPTASGFQAVIITNQTIASDTNLNLVLIPSGPPLTFVRVSGTVADRFGNGLSGAGILSTNTSGGSYSRLLVPGSYPIRLTSDTEGGGTAGSPVIFDMSGPSVTFSQDTTFNITVPAVNVNVHVQDPSGNAITNAHVTAALASGGVAQSVNTSLGALPFSISNSSDARGTNGLGDAVLQLIPGDSPATYNFQVRPPAGSPFTAFSIGNVIITPDMRLVFALQFSNRAPQAICKNVIKPANNNCQAVVMAQELDNGSSDSDGDPLTFSVTPPGPYSLGDTAVTLTVTDNEGASSSCMATITVIDQTPPSLTAPPAITVSTGATANSCAVMITDATLGASSVTDGCGSANVSRSGVPAGNIFPVGITIITYTATDSAGNTATATQSVIVIDNRPPTITCPVDIVVTLALGQNSGVVNFTPQTSDNCSVAAVTCLPASGSGFPVGTTVITCSVSDPSGNTSSCAFNVIVRSPQGASQETINSITNLRDQGVLSNGQANSLISKLESAIHKLNQGNIPAACDSLQTFINKVAVLINTGELSPAQGQPLIDSVTNTRNAIGCQV
jgi:HYR domain/Carboxypeptidase regulatory-like domain